MAFIFTSADQNEHIRSVAGLNLKNQLRSQWPFLSADIINYCKTCVLQGLSDKSPMIRNVAGSIITTSVAGGLIDRWPEVLPKLVELLDNPDTIQVLIR